MKTTPHTDRHPHPGPGPQIRAQSPKARPPSPPAMDHSRWWRRKTRKRFLAPWRREAADLAARGADPAELERHLAGLRGKAAIYHCISRTVNRERVFGPAEKEQFSVFLRQYEEFCQVRVLTWCMMGNHFHILVEIPEAPEDRGGSWSDERFLGHISSLYSGHYYRAIAAELKNLRKQGLDGDAEEFRNRFFARMWDLSRFMHDLKLRFAHWFNRDSGRDGHLWAEKFKSVLVESGHAARVVGAYIDLNPVRAGIVADPKDYRWSGYAEAAAGERRAREGLRMLLFEKTAAHLGDELGAKAASAPWREVAAEYRKILYTDGEESPRDAAKGRAGIPKRKVEEVLAKGGRLSEAEMIRQRVRHFSDGLAIGGEGFVEGVFRLARGYFGARRKTGARRIRQAETPLRAMRDLGKKAIGPEK